MDVGGVIAKLGGRFAGKQFNITGKRASPHDHDYGLKNRHVPQSSEVADAIRHRSRIQGPPRRRVFRQTAPHLDQRSRLGHCQTGAARHGGASRDGQIRCRRGESRSSHAETTGNDQAARRDRLRIVVGFKADEMGP